MSTQNIRSVDMFFLDELFRMGSGYVLNFSDRTMAEFFANELNIDIDDNLYKKNGTSKAKRLRYFLQTVDKPTVVKTLKALWEYREAIRQQYDEPENVQNAQGRLLALISQLEGPTVGSTIPKPSPVPAYNRPMLDELMEALMAIPAIDNPQRRGYEFEKFLQQLFKTYGLNPREPFRVRGEQIDGSFQFESETYLVEAKWQNPPVGVAKLHSFQGKIDQKAAWTRGLFISNSGFTNEGLDAFGRGKRVICMDGLDLYEALQREIPLNAVLEKKVRRAAETGLPFVRVRDLFPG
ncbi:restriction endonuclease [Parachitinimonas caeni]|uniref:Restriction endonuclease n=1 Tax=Parachitinimonas caeni TaxID=3031301 RepID=A0ABT7E4K4_9NEIS|nr:restriction endonuclease [Parachitinimonas caeni]MDK2126984.1 restriction endonuclease [Parachitinimonas caeni]